MKNASDGSATRGRSYDLVERTARFGECAIRFAKTIPKGSVTTPLIKQFVRSSTSVGANCAEADDAFTHREFRHRIGISRKEARETKHWLRMIVAAAPQLAEAARPLWQEARELHLIFVSILRTRKHEKATTQDHEEGTSEDPFRH